MPHKDSLTSSSMAKLYLPPRPKSRKVNLEAPKGPVTGICHLAIERKPIDNTLLVFRNDIHIPLNDDFYRPVIIQGKDKVVQRRSLAAAFDEKRKEIDQVFGKSNIS